MAWSSIFGQTRVKNLLQSLILENRVPHAICLFGIDGIGKEALALEFAKTVNCQNPNKNDRLIESCGECASCKKFAKLQHENLMLIYPLPTPKTKPSHNESVILKLTDVQIKEIHSQIEMKATNPYHKITLEKAHIIKIASIREVKRNLLLSSNTWGRRCVLVFNAEEMNAEAANAFLKTLEEPHDNVTIMLITSRPEMILPTIQSRCQKIRCEPLSDDDIAKALHKNHDINPHEAHLISVFAQGSLLRAENFLSEGMKELRQKVVDILRIVLKKKIYRINLFKAIEEFIKSSDKKKNEIFLNLMMIWLRDAFLVVNTGYTEGIINSDQKETISRFAENFKDKDIPAAISIIETAISQIRKNVQMQLIFINMFLEIRKIFLGRTY